MKIRPCLLNQTSLLKLKMVKQIAKTDLFLIGIHTNYQKKKLRVLDNLKKLSKNALILIKIFLAQEVQGLHLGILLVILLNILDISLEYLA